MTSSSYIADHLDQPCADKAIRWSRVNAGEQYPDQVPTLSWSVQLSRGDEMMRACFRGMGLMRAVDMVLPEDRARQAIGMRHGRLLANVDVLRDIMDRLPGDAGDALEEHLLGARPMTPQARAEKRTFAVARSMPGALYRSVRDVPLHSKAVKAWWKHWVRRIASEGAPAAREVLGTIVQEQVRDASINGTAAFCQQAIFGMAAEMLSAGPRDLLLKLPSSHMFPEMLFAAAAWSYANGQISRDAVIEEWGYFGASGGDVTSPSIRARPEMLDALQGAYAGSISPREAAERAQGHRAEFIDGLAKSVAPMKRPILRWLLNLSDKLAYSRELGRSIWLQRMDVARCAGAAIGRELASQGLLRDETDAFHLTTEELLQANASDLDGTAAHRKALYEWRQSFDLPNSFAGDPKVIFLDTGHGMESGEDDGDMREELEGIPASAGVARGTARVILSPFEAGAFERGDILVCRFTDPSWTPIMSLAGGIVADIGGALSHGAIIARELGIPAIVNTRRGTRRIPDGAQIEIDGTTGRIAIFEGVE